MFYQRTLDVLDRPFRIRPDVTIPVGSYQSHEWFFTQAGLPADIFGTKDRQLVVKMTYLLQR